MASMDGLPAHGVRGRSVARASTENRHTLRRGRVILSSRGRNSVSCIPRGGGSVRSEDLDEQNNSQKPPERRSISLCDGSLCTSLSSADSVNESCRRVTSSSSRCSSISSVPSRISEPLDTCQRTTPTRRRRRLRRPHRSGSLFQEDLSSVSSHKSPPGPRIPERAVDNSSFATRLIHLLTSLKDLVSGKCACSSFLRKKQSLTPGRRARGPPVTVNVGDAGKERPLLEDCVRGLGWETSTSFFNGGDIRWLGNAVPDYEHAMYVSSSLVVNRFPGLHDVAKKQYFARVLSSMQALQPEEYDFFPVTWILPEDRVALETVLRTQPKTEPNSPPSSQSPPILPKPPLGAPHRCCFLAAEPNTAEELKKGQPCPALSNIQKEDLHPRCGVRFPLLGAHRDVEFLKRMRKTLIAESEEKSEYNTKEEHKPEEDKNVADVVRTEANDMDENECESEELFVIPPVEQVIETGEKRETEKPKEESRTKEKHKTKDQQTKGQRIRDKLLRKEDEKKITFKESEEKTLNILPKLCVRATRQSSTSSDIQLQEASLSSSPRLGSTLFDLPGYSRWEVGSPSMAEPLNSLAADKSMIQRGVPSPLLPPLPLSLWSPVYAERTNYNNNTNEKDFFILKPDAGAQGMGVRLVSSGDTLPKDILEGRDGYIVQHYVADPYLLNGKKFDFRIYVLLLNLSPHPQVFVSRRGLVRFCTENYTHPKHGGLENPYAHLTNYAINKEHRLFMRSDNVHSRDSSKRLLDDVFEELRQCGVNVVHVWYQILTIVQKTIAALVPLLCLKYHGIYGVQTSRCFQIIGFDILLDKHCKAWLLEVNANPSLRSDYDSCTASSGVLETCESQLDRHVKEPLVREALILVYYSMISRSSGLSTYVRCQCRRTFENSIQQHAGRRNKEKDKKKPHVHRISFSPTQFSRSTRKSSELNKYVYLNSRKLQQGQAVSPAGVDLISYNDEVLWRRSLSQGEQGLFFRNTISIDKMNHHVHERTQKSCVKSKTVVPPTISRMIPAPAPTGFKAVDLPPCMPVTPPSTVVATVKCKSAAAASNSLTMPCSFPQKTAASLLFPHPNGITSTAVEGFPTSEEGRQLSLAELLTPPREPGGKSLRTVTLSILTARKKEHGRLCVKKGLRGLQRPYYYSLMQPQQQVAPLELLMDTTATSQPGNTYHGQKVSASATGTRETAANTCAHLRSGKDPAFVFSSVPKRCSFAPPHHIGAATALEASLHNHRETSPRATDQALLPERQKEDAGVYERTQENKKKEERHEGYQSHQEWKQTTPVQNREKTLKDTFFVLPLPYTTPELGPREKSTLLIEPGVTATSATTSGRKWTRTTSMQCLFQGYGANRRSSGQTVLSDVDSFSVPTTCSAAFNSHTLGPVRRSFPAPTYCGHATPGTPACTSVITDAGLVGGTPASFGTVAAAERPAAEHPAAAPAAVCGYPAGNAGGAVTVASTKTAEVVGVECDSNMHEGIAGAPCQDAALSLSSSIGGNVESGGQLTLLPCKTRARLICFSGRKASLPYMMVRRKANVISQTRSSGKETIITQSLPHSRKQSPSRCSSRSRFLSSGRCYEDGALPSMSCEARPRWSSAPTTSSRSPSLQSKNSPCCCNVASVCGTEEQRRCAFTSQHPGFGNVSRAGLNADGSGAAGTTVDAQQDADGYERCRQARHFRDTLRRGNFDVAPTSSSENLKETPSAPLTASIDAAPYFLFDKNMTDQLCVWEPLSITPPLRRPSSHLLCENPQKLLHLSGPVLLERGRRLFERTTHFPSRRTVQLEDWAKLCSQSGLQELLHRLWVTVPRKERSAHVFTGESGTGMTKAVRTCSRFQQRPLNKQDLILLYMRQRKEEMQAQETCAILENCGLSFWSFWEMLCFLSALTGLLLVRYRQFPLSEVCFRHNYRDGEHEAASGREGQVGGNSTSVKDATIEKCVSPDKQQQKDTCTCHRRISNTDMQSCGRAAALEQLITTDNAEDNSSGRSGMPSEVRAVKVLNVKRGNAAASASEKWSPTRVAGQGAHPDLVVRQKPNIRTSSGKPFDGNEAPNSFLVANPITLQRGINGGLAVRPDERIFVPWMPDIRSGYYSMSSEQRAVAVDCLLYFFGV